MQNPFRNPEAISGITVTMNMYTNKNGISIFSLLSSNRFSLLYCLVVLSATVCSDSAYQFNLEFEYLQTLARRMLTEDV